MPELTVPQIDFSSLGQLPQIYKQAQADNLRQQTLASLGQGGQADAQALLKSGDLSLAQLGIGLQTRQQEQERQARQDAINQQHWDQSFKLQQANAARSQANADREWNYDPTEERLAQAKAAGVDPNSPEGRQFILSGSLPEAASGKPIPFETYVDESFVKAARPATILL